MKKGLIVTVFILCCASAAVGFVSGDTNLGSSDYPAFEAAVPVPPEVKTLESAKRYRQEVEDYIKQAEMYVDAARNDVARINEEIGNAAGKVDEITGVFNQWAASNN